ncbi:MAG: hypothetical protein JWM36_3808 [Hyphomicrobiales bacterium]|nr:hypothetical protein [Hyphomicrobiales bacterium]
MDDDRVELLRRLFVAMAEIAEDATAAAFEGQGLHVTATPYAKAARQLQMAGRDLDVLAQAATLLAARRR